MHYDKPSQTWRVVWGYPVKLIKLLGGYRNAKERLKRENLLTDSDFNHGQRKLLEYRRQHNIFEVGDLVVDATDCHSNDLITVKSISGNLLVCESDNLNASYALSGKHNPSFYVRHATDDEIKAGKRLEVNQ